MKKRIFAVVILAFILLPVISIPIVSAEGDVLPSGFVTLEEAFGVDYRQSSTTYYSYVDSRKIDGYYLQLDYITFGCGGGPSLFGREGIYADTITSSLSQKPYITLRRGEVYEGFTVHGTSEGHDKDGNVTSRTEITVTIENMFFGTTEDGNKYNVPYAYFTGSANSTWNRQNKAPGKEKATCEKRWIGPTHENWDSQTYQHYDAYYLVYRMFGTSEGDYSSNSSGGHVWFRIVGVMLGDGSGASYAGTTQNANQGSGEDSGVSVPAAIAIGVIGGGAAVIAAAAAIAGTDNSGDDKKKKSYKMYVQKDFGDAIRKGAEPVKVRARMAEVDEMGAEHDRNDMTSKITASGEGMTVGSTAIAGRYFEAVVSIPEGYEGSEANITFTFKGEGGYFTNTVVFRAVDGPSLKFVEETEEAGAYHAYGSSCGIDLIPGDGFTYTAQFLIMDAVQPPKLSDITAEKIDDFDVEFEETSRQFLYKVIVKNNTKKVDEEEHDVFAKKEERRFEIKVVFEEEKEPVYGYMTLNLYPEGITVSSDMEGKKKDIKYVMVQAYEKEEHSGLDNKWQVSEIKFTLAVKGSDKSIIDPENAKYTFEKIKGSGGKGMREDKEESVAQKFKYKEEHGWNSDKYRYVFEPNSNLSEPEDGTFYMVLLPTEAEYDGVRYKAEVPLRLRGSDLGAKGDWEKEYKELQRRIIQFSVPGNMDRWIAQLKTCATEPRASVEELRLVSKWILREYMDYWTNQNKNDLSEAKMYNAIVNVLEWTKFAGDCAFSFLINVYAGPVAEALISPAKDFATSVAGELIAARSHGDSVDVDNFEFSKNLAAMGENLLSNNIKLTDWKKAAATLSAYFVYCAAKNYILKLREENVADFWGALCEAFKDMTFTVVKSKAGDLIGKWVTESKKFQEKILPFIQKYFKETHATTLQHRLNDALGLEGELRKLAGYANDEAVLAKVTDVVEKYIGNLVGEGFDKVRKCYDSSKFSIEGGHVICKFNLELFDAYKFGIRLDLTTILLNVSCPFYDWLYDLFFKGVPCAVAAIEKPKDPPLPPAND